MKSSKFSRLKKCLESMSAFGDDVIPKHREVVESFIKFWEINGYLTDNQSTWFESIEKQYGQASLKKKKLWKDQYDASKRLTAKRCAQYYQANPPYWSDLALKVLSDPDCVLSEKQFVKMCENKYAKKILNMYSAKPQYSVGQFVQIRSSNKILIANSPPNHYRGLQTRPITTLDANAAAVILEIDAKPITRAAKGARIYRILPVGSTSAVYAHEGDIKRMRKKK